MAKRKKAATKASRSRARTSRSGTSRSRARRADSTTRRRPAAKAAKRRQPRATARVREQVKAEQAEVVAKMRGAARARGMRVAAVTLAPAGPMKCPAGQVRIMVRVRDEHGTLIVQPKCVPR